ncbi:lipase family protein [Amycolatopsis sp. SID8362]|uniref:lipase family protein n=1 Tax=Amycolatopsis sp. SID8362 TaxID=2690346 RepID=UPI00136CDEB5|nr:lipase family protein [Amycolatopsis sp. SID8362]NBH11736.1 triacylglycerol lipase [Amycolatopsis sp. SID8362]NED48428.1 triacylglycerol lipase [Amycolatopsis sp. SID8362]
MIRTHARFPALAAALALVFTAATATAADAQPSDSFYSYDGSAPLSSYAPGTVLKTRTLAYHVAGLATPVQAVQLLYRTTDAQGRPSANVTSVVRSITGDRTKAVSYQSAYDSLDPADSPSRAIAGDVTLGGLLPNGESLLLLPSLLQGYNVVVPDTEGQTADFAAGPEYGTTTLDSIRAATSSAATGMDDRTKFGLLGYSGGAIATGWAAALAPSYAPDVNRNLVGFTEGGVLVDPAHNLKYVGGSPVWSGVIPMALIGVARGFGIDLRPYASEYGLKVLDELEHASIITALGRYPGLTWRKLVKPEYANPDSVPPFVAAVNKVNIGSAPTPSVPGFIAQGNAGFLEGTTSNLPGIGTGDGVMVAGDVRALARQYCATGNDSIKYAQYDALSHVGGVAAWAPAALGWLADRFAGKPAPSSCGHIPAGNSLAPEEPA